MAGMSGKKHSEEAKARISSSGKGRRWTEESRARFSSIRTKRCSIDGVPYESTKAAAEALGLAKCTVTRRINDVRYPRWIYL